MIQAFINAAKGLNIYVLVQNAAMFWWTGSGWTSDRALAIQFQLTEIVTTNAVDDAYYAQFDLPPGGPFSLFYFDAASPTFPIQVAGNQWGPQTPTAEVVIPNISDASIDTTSPSGTIRYREENIYNEFWVKRMAFARAQQQWGRNIMKYGGSFIPNGGTFNAEWIYNEGKEEVEKLTTQLHDEFELPIDFFIG